MVRHNRTKAKIKAGEVVSGVTVGVNDPNIVELAGLLGFDFAIIDCEHDLFNGRDLENIIRAANLHDVTPIVRMQNNPEFILHALNGGAQGNGIKYIKRGPSPIQGSKTGKVRPCIIVTNDVYNESVPIILRIKPCDLPTPSS
jgi:4-hydroxy-2-oxoheptanedioate aldolase